jgi:hypothetical protein
VPAFIFFGNKSCIEKVLFQTTNAHRAFIKLVRSLLNGILIRLHREPHCSESRQDFSLRREAGVNGIFRIQQRLFKKTLERIIFFRAPGGFKDFARNVFERTDSGIVESRMR